MGELSEETDEFGNRVPLRRRVLLQVARQNGKTLLVEVLSLYWMFVERHPLIIGMNATATDAIDVMLELSEFAYASELLKPLVRRTIEGNTNPRLQTIEGSTYKPVAASERAARGKRPQRVIIDELRLHKDWKAYNAAIPAMSAQKNAQAVFITNAGYDDSVVLNSLRAAALEYIETGTGSTDLAMFEWSAPENADIYDPTVWAYANPSLGLRKTIISMQGEAATAKTGTSEEANFKIEHLCVPVRSMDAAIDANKWAQCVDEHFSLKDLRPLAFCLDESLDGRHATLIGVYPGPEDSLLVAVEKDWATAQEMSLVRIEAMGLVEKHKPRIFTWMPNGPAAKYSTSFNDNWKPRGVNVQELKGEIADACMALADEVRDLKILHPNDPLLKAQVTAVAKQHKGDRWVFSRKGQGPCDAAYALAGAVYAARLLPPPRTKKLIGPDDGEE